MKYLHLLAAPLAMVLSMIVLAFVYVHGDPAQPYLETCHAVLLVLLALLSASLQSRDYKRAEAEANTAAKHEAKQ
jgi:TctA family transporter